MEKTAHPERVNGSINGEELFLVVRKLNGEPVRTPVRELTDLELRMALASFREQMQQVVEAENTLRAQAIATRTMVAVLSYEEERRARPSTAPH